MWRQRIFWSWNNNFQNTRRGLSVGQKAQPRSLLVELVSVPWVKHWSVDNLRDFYYLNLNYSNLSLLKILIRKMSWQQVSPKKTCVFHLWLNSRCKPVMKAAGALFYKLSITFFKTFMLKVEFFPNVNRLDTFKTPIVCRFHANVCMRRNNPIIACMFTMLHAIRYTYNIIYVWEGTTQ